MQSFERPVREKVIFRSLAHFDVVSVQGHFDSPEGVSLRTKYRQGICFFLGFLKDAALSIRVDSLPSVP